MQKQVQWLLEKFILLALFSEPKNLKHRRHLTEFWMVEPEVAFAGLEDDMDLAEEFLEYIVQTILNEKEEELKVLERDTSFLKNVKRPFPRIRYDEAVEILKRTVVILLGKRSWGNRRNRDL